MRFRLVKERKESGSTYHFVEWRGWRTLWTWQKCSEWCQDPQEAQGIYMSMIANRGSKVVLATEGSEP